MQSSPAPVLQAGLFPDASTYPRLEKPPQLTTPSIPPWSGFADGFVGGLIGGLAYCLILAQFHPGGLDLAWLRVLALSLTLGGFEMWRVRRRRTLRSVVACVLWTLIASLFVWCALASVISPTDNRFHAIPAHFNHSHLAPVA